MLYVKPYYAGAAVAANRFVKPGTADNLVIAAAASADALVGISGSIAADSGTPMDVIMAGPAKLKLGGTVTRGDPLTSDSSGRGVTITSAIMLAGTARCGAIALQSGVVDDLIDVIAAPAIVSKAAS